MIHVKENDLQSMDWYKEKEEDTQSMWLNFLMIVNQLYFKCMFQCFLDYQYYIVFYFVS